MKAIYLSDKISITIDELQNIVNEENKVEKLSEKTISNMMNELIIDFYGEIDFNQKGQTTYKFIRLREELTEAKRLREAQDTNLGRIVFES